MEINNISYINKCIICNGTGKLKCDCGEDNIPYKKCLTCSGEGRFICPICEGKGIL